MNNVTSIFKNGKYDDTLSLERQLKTAKQCKKAKELIQAVKIKQQNDRIIRQLGLKRKNTKR